MSSEHQTGLPTHHLSGLTKPMQEILIENLHEPFLNKLSLNLREKRMVIAPIGYHHLQFTPGCHQFLEQILQSSILKFEHQKGEIN